jgi:branched-subunit amino acid ABC-type transport system permease component
LDRTGWEYVGIVGKVNPNMGWFMICRAVCIGDFGGVAIPYGAIVGAFIIAIYQEVGGWDEPDLGTVDVTLLQNPFSYIRSFG